METKWLAELFMNKISPVQVKSETSKHWVGVHCDVRGERRYRKRTQHEVLCDTWEEAHAELLKYAKAKVKTIRRQLEYQKSKLGNVKGMKKPEEVE